MTESNTNPNINVLFERIAVALEGILAHVETSKKERKPYTKSGKYERVHTSVNNILTYLSAEAAEARVLEAIATHKRDTNKRIISSPYICKVLRRGITVPENTPLHLKSFLNKERLAKLGLESISPRTFLIR